MRFLSLSFFLLCVGLLFQDKLFFIEGQTMGTTYRIQYYSKMNFLNKSEIESIFETINQQMSTYREDSEISKINSAKILSSFPISEDFQKVIQVAVDTMKKFPQTYDITIGDIVNEYGFGPKEKQYIKKPYKYLDPFSKFQVQDNKIIKKKSSLYLDLSSIAKGYAVDQVAVFLHKKKIKNFLVEVGGELKASGKNKQRDWKVFIENPLGKMKACYLRNNAIATSGIYRNFYEENSLVLSHVISPKTGKPIQNELYSLSVVADEAIIADAYSTALMSLSKIDLKRVVKQENLKIYAIFKDGSTLNTL